MSTHALWNRHELFHDFVVLLYWPMHNAIHTGLIRALTKSAVLHLAITCVKCCSIVQVSSNSSLITLLVAFALVQTLFWNVRVSLRRLVPN